MIKSILWIAAVLACVGCIDREAALLQRRMLEIEAGRALGNEEGGGNWGPVDDMIQRRGFWDPKFHDPSSPGYGY